MFVHLSVVSMPGLACLQHNSFVNTIKL